MKKLLGIIVLGLLLSGNAYAAKVKVKEKMTKLLGIVVLGLL